MSDSEFESENVENVTSEEDTSNKRKRQEENWNRFKIKNARLKGEEYVNSRGCTVPHKHSGPPCGCRKKCTEQFSNEEKMEIISKLYNGRPKNEQDAYLQSLIECQTDIKRRRARKTEGVIKSRKANFKFFVRNGANRVAVCKKAFTSLHAIGRMQTNRLSQLLLNGESPKDLRGKHLQRPNVLHGDVIAKIKMHIESFPLKTSHYSSGSKSYLDARLNVRIMHNMFIKQYPDLENQVKYEYYLKYFKQNYNFRFGRPQIDVCSMCENLSVKLKDPNLNDNAKRVAAAELLVHKRRAKKFYTQIQKVTELCSTRDDVAAISFDYMQNLPLPVTPVQEMFYYRQLWVNVFEIHDLKSNTGQFYMYHEGQASKGPDEVCTFLLDYIDNHIDEQVQELHVFSDGCPGQNRNHTVVRFFMALCATKKFKTVHHYFPLRGHSFLPCDRDFGLVKRTIRKHDRVYLPKEYEEMIQTVRSKKQSFTIKQITFSDIKNFKEWWPEFYKKTSKSVDQKVPFTISKYCQFSYQSELPGYVKVFDFIEGLNSNTFLLQKANTQLILPNKYAYNEPRAINRMKIENIKAVLQYIPQECLPFYKEIVKWRQTDEN